MTTKENVLPLNSEVDLKSKGKLNCRLPVGKSNSLGSIGLESIEIPNDSSQESDSIFIWFDGGPGSPASIWKSCDCGFQTIENCFVQSVVVEESGGSGVVIDLDRLVVVDSEGKMVVLGGEALDYGIVVFSRTLLEEAQARAVPSELKARGLLREGLEVGCVLDHLIICFADKNGLEASIVFSSFVSISNRYFYFGRFALRRSFFLLSRGPRRGRACGLFR